MPTCMHTLSVPFSHTNRHTHTYCTGQDMLIETAQTCTPRRILGWRTKAHTQTKAHKHIHKCKNHTCTHRLWVSRHRLAMSGETGWLIALCTDGHTGGRKGEAQSCPLCLSASVQHFLSLSLCFYALSPSWSLLTLTPPSLSYARFISGSQKPTVSARCLHDWHEWNLVHQF